MQKYIKEIEKKLKCHIKDDADYKAFQEINNPLTVLGLRMPVIRQILCEGFSLLDKNEDKVLEAWDYVWHNSDIHEVMVMPLLYYSDRTKEIGAREWKTVKHWVDRIENWGHSDVLSKIYSSLLEKHPDLVYPTLVKWNKDKNPWNRRTSIVSLIYYASKKRKYLPADKILPLVKNLLHDKDMYVQKGVGWTLRECGNLYPNETWKFLKTNILDLSAIAFSYSTEKLSASKKVELKKMRKKKTRTKRVKK